MLACGPGHKGKKEMRTKRIEMRDSLKTLHPDSIVKYREIKKAKKRDCCAKCACKDSI